MPDETRPDRARVVASIDSFDPPRTPFEKLYVVCRAIDSPADLQTTVGRNIIEMFKDAGQMPVFGSFGGQKWIVYPSQRMAVIVDRPWMARESEIDELNRWREILGMSWLHLTPTSE